MNVGNRLACLSLAVAAALATSCSQVVPRSEIPSAQARHVGADGPTPAARHAGLTPGTVKPHWWEEFSDPTLDTLVALSMQGNHEVNAALAAVRQARAVASATRRDLLPVGSLEVKADAVRPAQIEADPYRQGLPRPPSQRLLSAAQGVSWELDLFGRLGTAAAVADRQADAAAADARGAAALLQAEVARHYVTLRTQQAQQTSLEREVALSQARLIRLQARYEAGLLDRRQALAAGSEQTALLAEVAANEARMNASRSALAVLAGRSPVQQDAAWQALLAPAPLPTVPDLSALAYPSDLLARRPDVAKADALLRASLGEVVLAERAHLPRLTLNVLGGVLAPFGALGDAGATRFSAGPALQWEWLNFGRRKAREAAARAGSEQHWHAFEQTVITALKESEDALHAWTAAQTRLQQATAAEASADRAAAYAGARAEAGIEPKVAALEQQAAQQRAQRERVLAQADLLLAHVQVQLVLGAWRPQGAESVQDISPPVAATGTAVKQR